MVREGFFFSILSLFFIFFFSCSCLKPPYPGHLACFSPGGGRRGCVHRPGAPLSSGWLQHLLGTKSLAAGYCAHRAALGGHSHVGKNTQNYEVQRCVHLRRSLRRELLGPCDLGNAPLHPSLLRALLQAPAVASVRCCRNALPVFPGCSVELGRGRCTPPVGLDPRCWEPGSRRLACLSAGSHVAAR